MRIALQFLLAIGLAVHTAAATTSCSPIPGADQLWSKAGVHWVFIGEMHGSNETPAAFRNLVCDAIAHGKHVTVALERPTSEQAALDNILTAKSKDLPAAKESLFRLSGWRDVPDGRGSEAMLQLLLSLRELHRLHPNLKVVAFDAPYTGTAPGARDEALGHALLSLSPAKPNDLVLILTGNLHAMRASKRYDLAAMYLPATEILSLIVTDRGGETWIDSTTGGCGPQKGTVLDTDPKRPYGIFLDPGLAPFGKVDGVLSLGVPLTASAPAAGEPSPIPACRAKFLSAHQAVSKNQ